MWDKEAKRLKGAARRGIALGLALAGLWALGLTADPALLSASLEGLALRPGLALSLLAREVGHPPDLGQIQALTGSDRLLFHISPLLAAGEGEVLALRESREPLLIPEEAPIQDPDLSEVLPQEPPSGVTGTVDRTAAPSPGDGSLACQGIYLYNRSSLHFDTESVSPALPAMAEEGPQILILHTHGSEAYTPTPHETYEPSDPYRTTDCTKNIVKVGSEMATVFRAHGFRVIHDTNLYDYPSYSGAYERSEQAVRDWLERYPSISVVLDVHRDALTASDGTPYRLITREVGKECAQVMLVVGTNGGGSSHVNWKRNLSFAVALQQSLTEGFDALARPIVLRSASFNQQLCSPGYLLVEVGGHGNTLSDAIQGARFWADTAARTLREGSGEDGG